MVTTMPRFEWTARDRSGRSVTGALDARSKDEVLSRLQAQGLTVMKVSDAAAERGGVVDFAARLDAHATGAADFTTNVDPPAPRREIVLPLAVALVFGGIGAVIVRVTGWPIPIVPGIVAAVFLMLAAVIVVMLAIGQFMPERAASAASAFTKRARDSRRGR